MMRQAQQQRAGVQGMAAPWQGPGPSPMSPGGGGFMSRLRQQMEQQRGQQPGGGGRWGSPGGPGGPVLNPYEQAEGRMRELGGGPEGGPGGGVMGRIPMDMQPGPFNRTPSGEIDLGGGRTPEWGPGMPGRVGEVGINPPPSGPFRPPVGREVIGGSGKFGDPYQYGRGSGGKPRPGPGMMPPGGGPGGPPTETIMPVGGPRVPPNMRGYLQKRAMMNRPPANVGGGANRVGMADQQGALSRAMQRGTGRAPPSRRFGRGRAGRGRGFEAQ
jgi:translation initiation factor IF-2